MEVIDDEVFYDSFDFSPDGGGFEPAADNYVLTKDTAIASGKTYYTKSGSNYTAVNSPAAESLGTYYEKVSAHKINVLIATPMTTKLVPKISSIYYFNPGAHTEGDGYLYQERELSDVFTFPNGKNGQVDSVCGRRHCSGDLIWHMQRRRSWPSSAAPEAADQLERASDEVDALCYGRIRKAGFESLTPFQREKIKRRRAITPPFCTPMAKSCKAPFGQLWD